MVTALLSLMWPWPPWILGAPFDYCFGWASPGRRPLDPGLGIKPPASTAYSAAPASKGSLWTVPELTYAIVIVL